MPVLMYRDPADGTYKPLVVPGGGGGAGADEVWIGSTEPSDPAIELWADLADNTGGGSGGGGADEVVVSNTQPTDPAVELWMDLADDSGGGGSGTYLDTSGGTMTGPLTLWGDPTTAMEAAPKQYVDQLVTVSTADPVAGVDIPARDGLTWIVVTA